MDLHYAISKSADILHKSLDTFPKTIDINGTPKPQDTLRPPELSAVQKTHHPPLSKSAELMPLPQLPFTYS